MLGSCQLLTLSDFKAYLDIKCILINIGDGFMNIHAILHVTDSNYIYAYDKETLHVRVRVAKDDATNVTLRGGDPYEWAAGGGGGNLNSEGATGWVCKDIPMKKEASTELFDFWFAEIKPPYRRLRYGFFIEGNDNNIFYGETGLFEYDIIDGNPVSKTVEAPFNHTKDLFCMPFLNAADVFDAPSWAKDTVWYQIFPERFANGDATINPPGTLPWGSAEPTWDNFFGGDIQGMINHLDYLADLGITGIYTCPIFKAAANHKYDTTDYMELDPQFGTKETFKKFVELAHERGIRVMLDIIVNHCGYLFGPWQDVLQNGENSKYKDWFHIRNFPIVGLDDPEWPNYDAFAFSKKMPKMKTENPEVRDYFLNVGRYWVEEFDIDGWRLDVSNEVDHVFWREFRKAVRSVKDDVYILGEIWHDSNPWLKGDQFDAVMNYPLTNAVLDYIAKGKTSASDFVGAVANIRTMYSHNVSEVSFNLLGSHDTERLLNTCGGDKQKLLLAYSFIMTLPGAPCIYYGDEIGMDGGDDPGCRKCMIWDKEKQDLDLFANFKNIIAIRKNHPSLRSLNLEWIEVNSEKNILIFKKSETNESLFIVLNNSNMEASVDLSSLPAKSYKDLILGRAIQTQESVTVSAFSLMILK